MKRVIIIAAMIAGGCGEQSYRPAVEFPVLPDLPAETLKECPGADAVTGSLGDLASKDSALAIEYARCKARKETAVGAYQDAQRLLRDAAAKANNPK